MRRAGLVALDELVDALGLDAEVLEPPELRARIGETASEVAAMYDVRAIR